MKRFLIIHRDRAKLQMDGKTYGDWRQYVAFLDDGSAVCCRISGVPATLAMIGFILLFIAAMCVLMAVATPLPPIWGRLFVLTFIGFAMLGPWLVTWFTPWRIVIPVSGRMNPDSDGSYWRDF
jgi:hypothetical protein